MIVFCYFSVSLFLLFLFAFEHYSLLLCAGVYRGLLQKRKYKYKCQYCGKEYIPKAIERNKYCSRECAFADWHRKKIEKENLKNCEKHSKIKNCKICGKILEKHDQKVCSKECRKKYNSILNREREEKKKKGVIYKCKNCGKMFKSIYGTKIRSYCSDKCKHDIIKNEKHNHKIKYRIKKREQYKESVNKKCLFIRDMGICYICGEKIDKTKKYPHPYSLSIDHVIPLSKGGEHSNENCKIAHLICNLKKNNKIYHNYSPYQLSLNL